MIKKISPAAINALKEALTHIYWYKSPLISFLRNTLTNSEVLSLIDPQAYKREIVSTIVDRLARHEDLYQNDLIKLMSETVGIQDFSHLEQLEDGKEKADKARKAVSALKTFIGDRDQIIKEKNEIAEKRRINHEEALKNKGVRDCLEKLNQEYLQLFSEENKQKRGYSLEKILKSVFEIFDLDPRASFKIIGEQIDGAFSFDGTDYIFETKWTNVPIIAADLDAFKGKLSRKLDNTLGLFLSINGFSDDAVKLHSTGRGMTILMDGQDLMAVLEGRIDLVQLLFRKRKHASQTGNIYLKIHEII
jgi:hypothetical protein